MTHIIHNLIKSSLIKCRTLNNLVPSSISRYYCNEFDDLIGDNIESDYKVISDSYLGISKDVNCYIIQPYVKWGPQKRQKITPDEQLEEAVALIKTLPTWNVVDTISVPLENLDKKTVFKSGSMDKLKNLIRSNGSVNAVFLNLSTLKRSQAITLEKEFRTDIYDRYKIVMQILKMHATSKHAKLQVALAELHYLQKTIMPNPMSRLENEKFKLIFQTREQKLLNALKSLRSQRGLLRSKRQKSAYPIVAVVGYTNAGKTSLIKSLTGEQNLVPKNQLFATLDVTMHAGILPSGLKTLYVDTVGFLSDIPTNLIECFVATLEDAVFADVVLHVEDLSSSCFEFKREHVEKTLKELGGKLGADNILAKTISVGNKSDLVQSQTDFGMIKVSSKTDTGIDALRMMIEQKILEFTDRKVLKIKLPAGGDEVRWLYKNATVVGEESDANNAENVIAKVIITGGKLEQFKHHYLKS